MATEFDLAECAREPIHQSGAIQPNGCLLVCGLADWVVTHISANAAQFLGFPPDRPILGRPVDEVISRQLLHDLRNTLQGSMVSGTAERMVDVTLVPGSERLDIAIHATDHSAIVEFTPHLGADVTTTDPIVLVKSMMGRLKRAPTFARFLQTAASQVRAVTGYDRVLIYRFFADGSGQVAAEALRPGLDPFMGLRYPASDIPSQARELYKRQWLRMIVDVNYRPVPLRAMAGHGGQPVDLSLAFLRSVSPVHLGYLRNMGSAATLTVSLMAGEQLWGLISCHHETPRRIAASTSAAAELFGQIFSLQVETKQHEEEHAQAARSRAAHLRLFAETPAEENPFNNLARFDPLLRDLIPCDGLGVWSDGRFTGMGDVPDGSALEAMIALLEQDTDTVFASNRLARDLPTPAGPESPIAGVMALRFMRRTRDYLMFFRRETVQTVTWAGDPRKPVENGPAGSSPGPRKSFAPWNQTVTGEAEPWRPAEIQAAKRLRVALLDMMLGQLSAATGAIGLNPRDA